MENTKFIPSSYKSHIKPIWLFSCFY